MIISEYRLADGEFTNRAFESSDADFISAVIADGCGFKTGLFNPDLHFVDLVTDTVVMPDAAAVARYEAGIGNVAQFPARWDRPTMQWVDQRTLADHKRAKIEAIKVEGLARIGTRFDAITTFDTLKLVRELMLSIVPAARSLTTDMTWLSNTYQAGKAAVDAVQASTTKAQVDAVTPAWPAL